MLLGLTVAGCSNDDAATLAEGEGGGAGELTDSYVTLDATGAFTVNLTTGVSQVEAEREAAPVYSISGLRVGTTADIDRLPAGIYISRGKKFIVK